MASHLNAAVKKVLEDSRVSPPQGSVPPSTISLSYFDLMCCRLPNVQRLFLYSLPCSTSTFLDTHIPNLKHSLSLALQRFYPLAGNLIRDDDEIFKTVSYTDGDSVAFTVVECDDDFSDLAADHPRNITRFHGLVPVLPASTDKKQPVLAIQVTLFPGQGMGIGTCTHHGLIDGQTLEIFLKTWASFSGSGCCSELVPSYDRSVLPDSDRLYKKMMKIFVVSTKRNTTDSSIPQNNWQGSTETVLATFVLKRTQLEKLRLLVIERSSTTCSSFALASGIVWTCLVKIRRRPVVVAMDDDEKADGFCFVSNCRGRLNTPIPLNYFGNCLDACAVGMKRSDLVGEEGWVKASVSIRNAIQDLKKRAAPFDGDVLPIVSRVESILSVAGSPNLGLYNLDFGWGRVAKSEIISIEKGCVMSIAENRNEEDGGVEIGIVLSADLMEDFTALFQSIVLSKHRSRELQNSPGFSVQQNY